MSRAAEKLRTEAVADDCLWSLVLSQDAYWTFLGEGEFMGLLGDYEKRTFLLFVACALEV